MQVKIEKKSKLTFCNPNGSDDSFEIVLTQPSIANKSKQYVAHLNDILETKTNKQWFYNVIKKFQLTQDPDVIYQDFLDKAIDVASKYSERRFKDVDIGSFVNRKKKTNNSILFDEKECSEIYILSAIIKLYAIVSGSSLVNANGDKINKHCFEYIIQKKNLKATVDKIHHVVYTKLFKCIGLDPTIMKTIGLRSTMSDDDFVLYLFDYVLSAILVIYDMERNPITFIVTSVDQVMIWHFRGLYQKAIAYKETGELFGKSMTSTNLPERIIADKIYEYIQSFVTMRNKENGVTITEDYGMVDRHFHNFFVMPLYIKMFNLKKLEDYNTFQKINIQLFLYYSMKDFMEKSSSTMFPKVSIDKMQKDKSGYEEYRLLEILKRVPITEEERYKVNPTSVFEDDEFMIDDSNRNNRNYTSFQYNNAYKIECISELLTSKFKFYGINNIMILNNYLKTVMNVLMGLNFKNLFTFDLTKSDFRARRYSKQLELEIFPFLMVILNNKMDFFNEYSQYVANAYCINRQK